MRHGHVFGSQGYYLIPSADQKNLDSNSCTCYFLGVLPSGNGVKVSDSVTKKIVKTQDVYFLDNHNSSTSMSTDPTIKDPKTNEAPWDFPPESLPPQATLIDHREDAELNDNARRHLNPDELPPDDPTPPRPTRARKGPSRFGNLVAHMESLDTSPTYKVSITLPEKTRWREAMQVEIVGLINRKVFTLVTQPSNAKIISCCWHLKKKLNLDGSLKNFKERLVARGFTQREGIDYQETFAPSSRQESLKVFLAVSGHCDWEVIQLNIVGAFLYGDVDEIIYLSQPEGFINAEHPTHVWKPNSSLYGLKQSARQWYQCLGDQLRAIGFQTAKVDPSLYVLKKNEDFVGTILVHVDDILFAGSDPSIRGVEKMLQEKFQLTRSEDISHFLSFDISRNRNNKNFTMNQTSCINDLVETHHL